MVCQWEVLREKNSETREREVPGSLPFQTGWSGKSPVRRWHFSKASKREEESHTDFFRETYAGRGNRRSKVLTVPVSQREGRGRGRREWSHGALRMLASLPCEAWGLWRFVCGQRHALTQVLKAFFWLLSCKLLASTQDRSEKPRQGQAMWVPYPRQPLSENCPRTTKESKSSWAQPQGPGVPERPHQASYILLSEWSRKDKEERGQN